MVLLWLGFLYADGLGALSSEVMEAAEIRLASSLLSVSSPMRGKGCQHPGLVDCAE